ncbi:TPA: sulfite reductase, beta subunit (hemoprotein) [Candidatus Poribacteria bacterium]|nr:sulfite reductase, beta subunit (hemoprotein) [Candidatus Poribacteria bacterium]
MISFYNVPAEIKEDIASYRLEVERFLSGDVAPHMFTGFRVLRGVYEQRTADTFMMRIRVPAGGLTPIQMKTIATLSDEFGNGVCHVTTRQDVQLHWVKLEDTPLVMDRLLEVGLTTRGGGGNTVRNITACSETGVCAKEAFDVLPYAVALTEYLIKDQSSYTLPRKFKIAFSGCSVDCAFSTINDLGFIARTVNDNGRVQKGFRVYAAGGMGARSRVTDLLEEFIPTEEVVYVAEAVKRLFDKHGDRTNKNKARLRFVMDRYGYEKFMSLYHEELAGVKKEGERRLNVRSIENVEKEIPASEDISPEVEEEFNEWLNQNVHAQKQNGYFSAKIRLPLGDISAENFAKLASIVGDFGEGTLRTTQDQNLILRWVHQNELPTLYESLKAANLSALGAGSIQDIACCAGANTCKLGICLSRGLAEAVTQKLNKDSLNAEALKGIRIKISGCPNACGHHPIGSIGFHGAARRAKGKLAPHYMVLLGGRVEEGKTTLGKPLGTVPAKNIPKLTEKFLTAYLLEKEAEEDFYDYISRKGEDIMTALVDEYSFIPAYEEDENYYYDWGSEEEFSLAGRGPGECGAGVFDMIEIDIDDAKRSLFQAKRHPEEASQFLYQAVASASKALLVTRGLEPKDDFEAFKFFEEKFIQTQLVADEYRSLLRIAEAFQKGTDGGQPLKENIDVIEKFVDDISQLYESMDSSLKFHPQKRVEDVKEEQTTSAIKPDKSIDLRGVKCPINYVKAKLELEGMRMGEVLEIFLDDGEPIQNVPPSLSNDGQDVKSIEKSGEFYRLLVEKKT